MVSAPSVCDPERWGLPVEGIKQLPSALERFWQRYRPALRTKTRDTSDKALVFWRGQLTMEDTRNFANIDRRVAGGDGQTLQHFMSKSPWAAQAVFRQIQTDIRNQPALPQGGCLILDESADAKAGAHSAGAGRQHNGRLGKLELSQVATTLVYYHAATHTWALVDGELFIPEQWFSPAQQALREKAGIPQERTFATKGQLGLRMLERAQQQGLPFAYVACDELYGRDRQFRAQLAAWGLQYAADVRGSTQVYLTPPQIGRLPDRGQHRKPTRQRVLPKSQAVSAFALAHRPSTRWQHVLVRPSERGVLEADFAVFRVWTVTATLQVRAEWLVIRRDANGDLSYGLLNGPDETPVGGLIERSCWRFFTERAYQDGKSELGWADFQATKYRAWEHEMALTAAATWFIAEVKLHWQAAYPRDPSLQQEFELELLPLLSTANVREMLAAALPLPQMTPELAQQLVTQHLVNRARSSRSRRKKSQKLVDTT